MSSLKLYEISELETILEGEEDEEVAQALQEMINTELEKKADGIFRGIKNLEMSIPALDAEIARLTKMKERQEKQVEGIKGFILSYMIQNGKDEIKTPIGKFKVGKSTRTVIDENKLPEKAFVETVKVDRKRLSVKELEEMGLGEESGVIKVPNYKLNMK